MKCSFNDSRFIAELFFMKSFCCLGRALRKCLACIYCRLLDDSTKDFNFSVVPGKLNPAFRKLPVAVNLFYGDPMLQVQHTLGILRELELDRHIGPVIVITKGDFARFPKEDFSLDLHFAFSTFGIDHDLDGCSTKSFLANLRKAQRFPQYKYSIEFRPIVCGINDGVETIDFVMKAAADHGLAVGYSGLQGKPAIVKQWQEQGLDFQPYPGYRFGHKKIIADYIEERLQDRAVARQVSVFRKTSCLMSFVHNLERDYNAHYFRPNEVGCDNCPMKEKCFHFRDNLGDIAIPDGLIPFRYEVVFKENHVCILKKKGICEFPTDDCSRIRGHLIKVFDNITTSDVRVIKWLTGMTVDAEFEERPYISACWRWHKNILILSEPLL